jgi:hypothetical protein
LPPFSPFPNPLFDLNSPAKTKNKKQQQTEASWRKSHQWVGLTRKHAAATAADTVVAEAFKRHCTNAPDPDLGGAWRSCFSDEHYFPTLLAIGGWDSETVRCLLFADLFFPLGVEVEKSKEQKISLDSLFPKKTKTGL